VAELDDWLCPFTFMSTLPLVSLALTLRSVQSLLSTVLFWPLIVTLT